MIAAPAVLVDHAHMSSPGSTDDTSPGAAGPPERRRNPWIWISALLAVVAIGVAIWALTLKSDLDSTQQELAGVREDLDSTQQALDAAQQDVEQLQSEAGEGVRTGVALGAGKLLYDEFAEQLGATNEDLAATQQDLEDAQKSAEQAEKEAEAAKQKAADATDETEKAQAEADQARAELEAAEARAATAADCAKAYISALGPVFEGEGNEDEVRQQLSEITAACKDALGATG
jgi:septal ring factor EnvC (AmiA/AmiB activator)